MNLFAHAEIFLPRVPEPGLEVLVVGLELLLAPIRAAVLDLEVDGEDTDQDEVEQGAGDAGIQSRVV